MQRNVNTSQEELQTNWPLNIGSSIPGGKGCYEFAIYGDSNVEATSQVIRSFLDHKVRILRGRIDADSDNGTWFNVYSVDLQHADCSALQLEKSLRLIGGIKIVQHVPRNDSIFSFFTFPVMMNGRFRAYIMRAESLYRIEERMKELMGTGGGAIMFQEGRAFGSGVARSDSEVLDSTDLKARIKTARDGSKATGFGILDFEFSDDSTFVNVVVKEPLVDSAGECKSHFLFGIIAGVIETIHRVTLKVDRWTYDKDSKTLRLKYFVEK